MALNFPDSPTTGQVYTAANKSWTYDGSKWIISQYDNSINDDVLEYIDTQIASIQSQVDLVEEKAEQVFQTNFLLMGA